MSDYRLPSDKMTTPVVLVDADGNVYTAGAATGGATEAKQDDIIAALEGVLTVAIDQTVFGTTNAFYLAGVNAGGAQLVKAEDSAAVSGDVGVSVLAVRQDTLVSLVDTDGDYANLKLDSLGRLWVTGTWLEDAVHSSGAAGHFVLAVRNDAGTALAGDGDYIGLTVDAQGRLWIAGTQTEDAAHTSGDRGVFVLGVRKDTPTALAGADGDYQTFIFGSDGSLWVSGLVSTAPGDPSASITRTNDTNAYLANDVIGAATGSTAAIEFASIGPNAGSIRIIGAELRIDATAAISGETSYRLHLYSVTPPGAYGDNTAWDLPSGDRASYLGYLDLGSPLDLGSTLYVQSEQAKDIKLAGTSVFAYLVTLGAYTPTASRVFTVKLHAVAK